MDYCAAFKIPIDEPNGSLFCACLNASASLLAMPKRMKPEDLLYGIKAMLSLAYRMALSCYANYRWLGLIKKFYVIKS